MSVNVAGGLELASLDVSRKTILDQTWFCALLSFLALANMFVLGFEADLRCLSKCKDGDNSAWQLFDNIFTALFVADVILALVVLGPKRYFMGEIDQHTRVPLDLFHVVDFTLVILRVLDVWVLAQVGTKSDLKVFSALRVIHLGRFAKQVQLIEGFRELWLIMAGMADTLRTVLWVALLLVLVIWVFAVSITILVNDGTPDSQYNFSASFWTKDDYWGSVFASVHSLFQLLTRDKWSGNMVWPLIEANNSLIIFFVLFIAIASFALLNTIIGAVVESTLRSARDNEEKEARERQRADTRLMSSLEMIFAEADADGSGDLDEEELREMMRDSKVKKALNQLGIPMRDLEILFQNLDDEGQSKIKTETFFRGCTRLRGPAMARDLQHVSVDMDRHCHSAGEHIKNMRSVNDDISDILDVIDAIETDIVKDPHDDRDPVILARRGRQKQSRSAFLRSNKNGEWDSRSEDEARCSTAGTALPASFKARSTGGARRSSVGRQDSDGGKSGLRTAARQTKDGQKGPMNQPAPPPLPPHLRKLVGSN